MLVKQWPNKLGYDVGRNAEVWTLPVSLLKGTTLDGLLPYGVRVFNARGNVLRWRRFYLAVVPSNEKLNEMVRDCKKFGARGE